MRFNKQELATLATQPSNKFDKEGVLFITERQEGFFRRSEGTVIVIIYNVLARTTRITLGELIII